MYSSKFGHTSSRLFFPVISSIFLNNSKVHEGTPEILVTSCCIVAVAIISIFDSHSSISAIESPGVLKYSTHTGRC